MSQSFVVIPAAPPLFLGTGLSFPMRLDMTQSRPVISKDDQLVLESMDQIINTDVLERPFLTKNGVPFGTQIKRILFGSADIAIDIIKFECKRALDLWEPRIIVESVTAQEVPQTNGGSLILASIFFRFRSTNRSDNFVVPFRFSRAA